MQKFYTIQKEARVRKFKRSLNLFFNINVILFKSSFEYIEVARL